MTTKPVDPKHSGREETPSSRGSGTTPSRAAVSPGTGSDLAGNGVPVVLPPVALPEDVPQLMGLLQAFPDESRRLEDDLGAYRRGRQVRVFFSRLLWASASLITTLLLFLLVERTPIQSEFLRFVFGIAFYAVGGTWIFLALQGFVTPPSQVALAVEIEAASPRFRSLLASAADFQTNPSSFPGTSATLRQLTVAAAGRHLAHEDLVAAWRSFSRRQAFTALIGVSFFLGLWLMYGPMEVRQGFLRLVNPFADLAPFSGLDIAVRPGNLLVAKGETVQIMAIPNLTLERDPVLHLFKPGSEEGTATEMYPDESASRAVFVYPLTGLQESTDYQVSAGRFVSPRFAITVMARPEIKRLQLTLHHPAYIASQPEKLPEGTGDCTVLVGTRIDVEGESSQRLKSAQVFLTSVPPVIGQSAGAGHPASGTPVASSSAGAVGSPADGPPTGASGQAPHPVITATVTCDLRQGDTFSTRLDIATSTRWFVRLTNDAGLRNEQPVTWQINTVEDASPTVDILKPGVDVPFPKSRRLDLKVEAKDDFGVVSVILYYSIGDRRERIPHNLKADFSPAKEFQVDFPWMLDTIDVLPGTEIRYFVQAEDGRKPVPNTATTTFFHVKMPSMYDAYRGSEEAHDDLATKLKEITEAQQFRREALKKAYEEIKHEGKLDEAAEKQIQQAIQDGEQRQKEAQEVLEKVTNLEENLKNNPFSSPEALEKMQKVNELMNQVLDEEGRKLMDQLRKSLTDMKMDPKDLEKYEEAFKMDDYLKKLDRTVELLTQLKEQMKLDSLGQAVQDLKRRQEAIASATEALEKKQKGGELTASETAALEKKKQDGTITASEAQALEKQQKEGGLTPDEEARLKELAQQQEKIREELESLQKQAKELAEKKTPEGEQPNPAMEDVKNLRDRMKDEDFQKLSEQIKKDLENKNLQSAREQQQKMLKFLESLAKEGQKICQSCSGGGQPPQMDLSRFVRRALQVSRDQETLYQRLEGVPIQFMRGQRPAVEGIIDECSVLQVMVKQQGQQLEDALETLVRSSFTLSPDLLLPLEGVQGIFSGIVKTMEDRAIGRSRSAQREIIRRFNRLAMELMRSQDQQNQSQSQSPSNAMQQFKDLTRRQLSLYQQAMRNQMSPADKQMMEQMRRMAMEQRMVREALEKLMRESRQQTNTLGRMDDVMKEMQDLETKILDPALRKEVAEKQKAIYERMLKAQKSLRNRDEENEERKAEKASEVKQIVPDKPLPTLGTDTRDLARDFLGEVKEDYPPTYQTLLNDYYKSLSLYGNQE